MNKIDLSKAKIGDKFRTRDGRIATFHGRFPKSLIGLDYYVRIGKGIPMRYFVTGMWLPDEETQDDLVEQVFDKPLDELIEEGTKQIKERIDAIEEENELQRRQEVVELADRIFFSERGSAYSFKECIEVAEHSVNMINQYLNEGKL